jgi:hypothetical protein
MTDRERIIELLDPIQVFLTVNSSPLNEVNELVGKNQNSPPLGEADGSLEGERWIAARDAYHAIQTFKHSLERIKRDG